MKKDFDYLIQRLKNIKDIEIKTDIHLKNYTSFKVGGPAAIYTLPHNINALKNILLEVKNFNIPFFIMGKGTNVIVGDKGFKGIVIHTINLNNITVKNNIIKAESGINLSTLAGKALNNSLSGLEFASGIPGSLGGAIYMNAGAYGSEMKDVVTKTKVLNYLGKEIILNKSELNLSYRNSILQDKPYIAVEIEVKLEPGNKVEIRKKMNQLNQKRKEKQPLEWPSAGSIFKRPPDNYVGALIENAGLKGTQIGGAQVSEKHAGFIINKGDATAVDIKKLISKIQEEVYQKFGVKLEPEPRFIGKFN